MSNSAELIAEQEAATLVRVSASTLARFAEAGYFQVEMQGAERLYSRRALASVFGVTLEGISAEMPQAVHAETQAQTAAPILEAQTTVPHLENVIPFPQQTATRTTAEQSVAAPAEELTSTDTGNKSRQESPVAEATSQVENSNPAAQNSTASQPAASVPFNEILRMHSDILARQEQEIHELKAEREWLRRRIEKLEEKAERDQVLLLSEAQTVKQLIQLQSQKKSTIRQALEWFGILEEQKLPIEGNTYQTIGARNVNESASSADRNS